MSTNYPGGPSSPYEPQGGGPEQPPGSPQQPGQYPYPPSGPAGPAPGQAAVPYAGAPYAQYAPAPPKNDLGTISLVCGILSWIVCPLVLGIVAIATGNASRKAIREGLANNPGSATAGLVLGWLNVGLVGAFLLMWLAWVVFAVLFVGAGVVSGS
ncbi:hypothetical protein GCM10027059_25280 [Myceligenerans halotolerans]